MVHYQPVDRTLAALADPTRRAVLERLGRGGATISELAEPFGMSLTGMKKHIRVLEEAHLVATLKVGRTRHCRLGPRRLDDVQTWIETYRHMVNDQLTEDGAGDAEIEKSLRAQETEFYEALTAVLAKLPPGSTIGDALRSPAGARARRKWMLKYGREAPL